MENYSQDLYSESDVETCKAFIRDQASALRYSRSDIEKFILGVSEIARNAIKHSGGGNLEFSTHNKGGILRVMVTNEGPGILAIAESKIDGFSTIRTSLGIGLIRTEQSVDLLNIESTARDGTRITIEKHRPLKPEFVDYGLVSIADPQHNFNGDQYIIKEYNGDSILVGLIDGPGQDYDAYAFSSSCKAFIEENYLEPIDQLLASLDLMMKESNNQVGITASLARITPGKMIYKGFGDTHAYLVKDGVYNSLINKSGPLGQMQKYRHGIGEYSFHDKLQIVLCTDGISVLPIKQALRGSAQNVVNSLFGAYRKSKGDASVLALKYKIE